MHRFSISLLVASMALSSAKSEEVAFDEDGFFDEEAVSEETVTEETVLPPLDPDPPEVSFDEDGFFDESEEAAAPSSLEPSFGEDGFFEEEETDEGFDEEGFFDDESTSEELTIDDGPKKWWDRIELTGSLAMEHRVFFEDGQFAGQFNHWQPSLVFEPELYFETKDRKNQFRLSPFFRYDFQDSERTHFDLREANWRTIGDGWDLVVGVDKVFWGVTESRHLVDIINQFDTVEDIDEEDKLGQPLINLNLVREWGTVSAFLMPYFRERTFAGRDGRPRTGLPVDDDNPIHSGSADEWYPSVALRYKHTIGGWDIGASYFHGVSREPTFVPNAAGTELRPRYELIDQLGVDVQYTKDAWLWKLEAIARSGQGDNFIAAVGGFEYTIYQIFESSADLGLLVEYLYDGRSSAAPPTAFENDIFVGARYALNDTQDTSVLAGGIIDPDDSTASIILEAERRLGDSWKVELEARLFTGDTSNSPSLNQFADDSFVNLRLGWYF